MQKLLSKRVSRELRNNFFRYFALFLLIVLGMYFVVSIVAAAETIIAGVSDAQQENRVEDGQFGVFVPLNEAEIVSLESKGITLEQEFYLDFIPGGEKDEDSIEIRVYRDRQQINRISLREGRLPVKPGEIVLEQHYADKHELGLGDVIQIGGKAFQLVGIGSTPDYDAAYKSLSDSSVESYSFGTAFVSGEDYEMLKAEGRSNIAEEYQYSYLLNDSMSNDELKELIREFELDRSQITNPYFLEMMEKADELITDYFQFDYDNLTYFIPRDNNMRIGASVNDVTINKYAGVAAGVIVMALFTYVISVFVIHGIEQESSVIGALYALGVKRKQLVFHYLMLPVAITLLGGLLGTILGFMPCGVDVQMAESVRYFSLPVLKTEYPVYLIIYGIIMPPVIAAFVNYFVISKNLKRTALSLLRMEQKRSGIKDIKLGKLGFVRRFQLRQLLRELRSAFTVIIGMFIALLILMLGVNCYVLSRNLQIQSGEDTKYEYMYTYKYPTDQVPEGGEACYTESLKKEAYGYQLEVMVIGIDDNNPYFNVQVPEKKNEITISEAVASKFKLNLGDKLVLTDDVNNQDYAFTVKEIVPYSVGLYTFLDLDTMRELFGQEEDYYNTVFSDHELSIDEGRLYATISREDIVKGSEVFINQLRPMIISMVSISAIIFVVVMYLMMKVMIDRSAFSISLLKIFGYRKKEIKRLYLNSNFILIALGALLCIPLSKLCMDNLYPYLISNVACGIDLTFSWSLYVGIYLGVILCYLIINQFLVTRLGKMVPALVLKNRE